MKKRILLVCEKPLHYQHFGIVARELYPDASINGVCLVKFGPGPSGLSLRLPKNLNIGSVPIIIDPDYTSTYEGDHFLKADEIVFVCDPDPRGAYMFSHHTRKILGTDQGFKALFLRSLGTDHVRAEFMADRSTSDGWFRKLLAIGEARYHFNALWAANSLPLYGKLLRDVGSPAPQTFISKTLPLLMFALRRREERKMSTLSMGGTISLMKDWKGSGLYQDKGVGSETSRHEIINQGMEAGLLVQMPSTQGRISLTEIGHEFLSRLHPDCDDPDMIFRLDNWGRDWPASKPKADRYIRTYFGKMKRHMGKFSTVA